MKFSKSQRTLHEPDQYFPSPNLYQITNSNRSNNLYHKTLFNTTGSNKQQLPVTGTLKGPSFSSNNTFGYAQRFYNPKITNQQTPGPATYSTNNITHNKSIHKNTNKSNFQDHKNKHIFNNQSSTPSIPHNYYGQNADQQEQLYIQELKMLQDKTKAEKIIKKENPSFTFSKSQRKNLNQPKINNIPPRQKLPFIVQQQQYYRQFVKKIQNSQNNMKKTAIIWQQKLQKSNDRRREIISMINPQFIPSLQLIDLMSKKKTMYNPGPGHYNEKNLQQKSSIDKHIKGAVTFGQALRFSIDKQSIMGPGKYAINEIKKQKGFSFGKSKKIAYYQNQINNNDTYRYYIDPQGKKQQQKSGRKRVQFAAGFGSGSIRFCDNGSYLYIKQKDMCSTAASRVSNLSEKRSQSTPSVYKDIQKQRMKSKNKFMKKIKRRLNKDSQQQRRQQGLLGIEAMVQSIL